jgi:hypothetical protein
MEQLPDHIKSRGVEGVSEVATEEEVSEAMQLLESDEVLKTDLYARKVIEDGGAVELNGETMVVDLGNFLAARRAIIEQDRVRALDPRALEAAKVVHSDPNETVQ